MIINDLQTLTFLTISHCVDWQIETLNVQTVKFKKRKEKNLQEMNILRLFIMIVSKIKMNCRFLVGVIYTRGALTSDAIKLIVRNGAE